MAAFASNISPAISRPPTKKGRPVVTDYSQNDDKDLPEYLHKDGNDPSVIREYHEIIDAYNSALYGISAKEIAVIYFY